MSKNSEDAMKLALMVQEAAHKAYDDAKDTLRQANSKFKRAGKAKRDADNSVEKLRRILGHDH